MPSGGASEESKMTMWRRKLNDRGRNDRAGKKESWPHNGDDVYKKYIMGHEWPLQRSGCSFASEQVNMMGRWWLGLGLP